MRYPFVIQAVGIAISLNLAVSTLTYDPSLGDTAVYYSGAAYCNKTTLAEW
jgi:hypothetical protein